MPITYPDDPISSYEFEGSGGTVRHRGLTKLEHFALHSLPLAREDFPQQGADKVAQRAIEYANSLIEQLNK